MLNQMNRYLLIIVLSLACPLAHSESGYESYNSSSYTDTSSTDNTDADTSASSGVSNTAKEAVEYWQKKYDTYLKGDDKLYEPASQFRAHLASHEKQTAETPPNP